jgi:hypothetical protein
LRRYPARALETLFYSTTDAGARPGPSFSYRFIAKVSTVFSLDPAIGKLSPRHQPLAQ